MFRNEHGQAQRIAAYGVCTNMSDEMLLVRLNDQTTTPGVWTLPGGGIDFGEAPIDAVVRECEEETGLHVVVRELLTVDSMQRHIRRLPDTALIEYHAVRILYRVAVVGGTLRDEIGNSTDRAAWLNHEMMDTIHCTEVAKLGRSFSALPNPADL